MTETSLDAGPRQSRQAARQQAITEVVMAEGTVRIEQLAERFGISVMTVHRDLDGLEARGLLRKSRGVATAMSTSLVESSDVYRSNRQTGEKEAIALAALEFVEPGQAVMLDDSTSTFHLVPHLRTRRPLTVITNTLTVMDSLRGVSGITLLGLGGQYFNWCSAFMGGITTAAIEALRADLFIMSTAAITDDVAFHQSLQTNDIKRAMFDSSTRRILIVDHTKFEKRALHALMPLTAFDAVIVDSATGASDIARLRDKGVEVVVARTQRQAGVA
ncbi:DeoR/GlpR family DNA-binding transcription regulator [Microbacterium sp.]|uniref:DeoR/GlpR family DNA-binding transcription regulator n=1 Tax=Microbacterium sp. TaxID=51671 RepID=UPI003C755004